MAEIKLKTMKRKNTIPRKLVRAAVKKAFDDAAKAAAARANEEGETDGTPPPDKTS